VLLWCHGLAGMFATSPTNNNKERDGVDEYIPEVTGAAPCLSQGFGGDAMLRCELPRGLVGAGFWALRNVQMRGLVMASGRGCRWVVATGRRWGKRPRPRPRQWVECQTTDGMPARCMYCVIAVAGDRMIIVFDCFLIFSLFLDVF
jgi:hypothetical protein